MGEKNQNVKKSLGLQTKPKKIPGPKFNPPKSHAEFLNHKNFQKALHETLVLNTSPPPKRKILAKIFPPKKILRSSLSLEIQSTPPGSYSNLMLLLVLIL